MIEIGNVVTHCVYSELGQGIVQKPVGENKWEVAFDNGSVSRTIIFHQDELVFQKSAPLSKRDLTRLQNEQFEEDFISFMSDGEPHCLRDIGPAVGNTYITGLSARIRSLRKNGLVIKMHHVGTPNEGTWYLYVGRSN